MDFYFGDTKAIENLPKFGIRRMSIWKNYPTGWKNKNSGTPLGVLKKSKKIEIVLVNGTTITQREGKRKPKNGERKIRIVKKELARKWYLENKEITKDRARAWLKKDPIRYKQWIRVYSRNYAKIRRAADPIWALKQAIRELTNQSFRRQGYKKGCSTYNILGCDFETFKAHLEKQFKPDMTWENRAILWEIDHIVPLASGKSSYEETYNLGHYTNLQPLYKEENRRKSDNLSWQAPENQIT